MTKKMQASFTNNPLEYGPGDKVIQIYPVARPLIGLVVGSNKVEGKVYVNWNGRTMQVDPEEIQLAMGTPFFPSSRTASKSEERKLEKIVTALAETGSPLSKLGKFHAEFEKNLIKAGIANDEADDISHQYEDGFKKRISNVCLDPVPPVCGETVIVLDDAGSKPGKVGIFVGSEGADAIIDLNTDWSPVSNGSQLFRIPMVAVVPVHGSLRERLNGNACCASVNVKKERKASSKVANQAFCLFIASVKNVEVFDIKDFKAWVETTALPTGEVVVSAVVEKGGECDPLLKIYPIFNQRLAGFNIQNETDYKNAVQRVIPLIDNCKSSIYQYFQNNIIPDYVEEEVKKSLTASSSKVIIHDLNNDSKYEISSPEEAKDKTDKSAAEEAFKSGETVTMGKVVAEYVASKKIAKVSELVQIFMDRDDMTEQEAKDYVKELRERVADGENPEEVLYDEGLEPDYIFDLM